MAKRSKPSQAPAAPVVPPHVFGAAAKVDKLQNFLCNLAIGIAFIILFALAFTGLDNLIHWLFDLHDWVLSFVFSLVAVVLACGAAAAIHEVWETS